jgi:hypothetical protein
MLLYLGTCCGIGACPQIDRQSNRDRGNDCQYIVIIRFSVFPSFFLNDGKNATQPQPAFPSRLLPLVVVLQ